MWRDEADDAHWELCAACPVIKQTNPRSYLCETHLRRHLAHLGGQTRSLRRTARRLLCSSGSAALPIDIVAVARTAGLSVARDVDVLNEYLPDSVGGLMHEGYYGDTIVYNSSLPAEHQRFVIAHELAEWHLGHEKLLLGVRDRHEIANDYQHGIVALTITNETRSDIFALELLMSAPLLLAELALHGPDLRRLARIFAVADWLVQTRLWLAGIDPERYQPDRLGELMGDEEMGPWGRLLDERFYGGVSPAACTAS